MLYESTTSRTFKSHMDLSPVSVTTLYILPCLICIQICKNLSLLIISQYSNLKQLIIIIRYSFPKEKRKKSHFCFSYSFVEKPKSRIKSFSRTFTFNLILHKLSVSELNFTISATSFSFNLFLSLPSSSSVPYRRPGNLLHKPSGTLP
jgi:hypothetical protein